MNTPEKMASALKSAHGVLGLDSLWKFANEICELCKIHRVRSLGCTQSTVSMYMLVWGSFAGEIGLFGRRYRAFCEV